MFEDLKNKKVLVIGCGLIGNAVIKSFLNAGTTVIAADKNERNLKNVSRDRQANYHTHCTDILNEDSIAGLKHFLKEKNILLDGMIICVESKTGGRYEKFENYSREMWKQIIDLHLTGTFLTVKIIGSEMALNNRGSIITFSSIYGVSAPDQRIYKDMPHYCPAAYSAAKAGVIGFTKYMATYWHDKKTRINCISPGGIEADQKKEFKKRYSGRVPMGRMGTHKDIPGAAAFLISDSSSYITGQNIIIDGGLTVW